MSITSGEASSERQRSSTVRKSPVTEVISLVFPREKEEEKRKSVQFEKKTLQIKGPQTDLLNSVCSSVPQIDLMLCKRTDSEVELIANLHIHITNIAFRSLFNTPKP